MPDCGFFKIDPSPGAALAAGAGLAATGAVDAAEYVSTTRSSFTVPAHGSPKTVLVAAIVAVF